MSEPVGPTLMQGLNRMALIEDLCAFWHNEPANLAEVAEEWLVEHGFLDANEESA